MSRQFYVSNSIQSVIRTSGNPNHTFNRTFNGAAKLLDTGISTPSQAQFQANEETLQEIPHALKAEIFQLENTQKFKILLDPERSSKNIQLICYCEDKLLPCLPPICVIIPTTYPFKSPRCSLPIEDYFGTEFLRKIYANLLVRIERLPRLYSLTRLLEAWEIAVRQALSPDRVTVADLSEIFGV